MNKLNSLQQINTNVPRETLVFSANDLVVKQPVSGALSPKIWLDKQKHAKQVMDSLNKIGNSKYFVPEMLEISPSKLYALERRAYGHPLNSSYFETLSAADQDIIYNAIAHFMNDINQSKPILNQSEFFDTEKEVGLPNKTFDTIITELKSFISEPEYKTLVAAKEWFDTAAKSDASVVFSHGDMNENNIFYDPARRVVSFIDFADAKYENITYMFERDFGKLGWLDLDRIRREYMALPRKHPVIITANPNVTNMRIALQNTKWIAIEFLKSPNTPAGNARRKMIQDEINKIQKLYAAIPHTEPVTEFARGADIIRTAAEMTQRTSVIKNSKGKRK